MLLKRYDLTLDDYEKMLKDQDGVCAICKKLETHRCRSKEAQPLSVDHDHTPGKIKPIRGLLCNGCNQGIQTFRDNTNLIQKAIEFLENDQAL